MSSKKIELFDINKIVEHAENLYSEKEYGYADAYRLVTAYRSGAYRQALRDQKIVDELLSVIQKMREMLEEVDNKWNPMQELYDKPRIEVAEELCETLAAIDARLSKLGVNT